MQTRDWLMTDHSLVDDPIESFTDLTDEERTNLAMVFTQLKGWVNQDVDQVLSVMAEDGVYYDITGEPAVGHTGIREFGNGWIEAVPDFTPYIEALCVKGNTVCDMGRIRGTITKEFYGNPATGKKFDCQFMQICFIENGKIKYVRDHWNAADMYNQVGWDTKNLQT